MIFLTNHQNEIVRCYSYIALKCKEKVDMMPIITRFLYDTTSIVFNHGCLGESLSVSQFTLIDVYCNIIERCEFKLSKEQMKSIDSLLIFDKNIKTTLLNLNAFLEISPKIENYDRIREIYLSGKYITSIVALAKYQNQNDKQYIIKFLESSNNDSLILGLKAVSFFPDSFFFIYLKKIHAIEINKELKFINNQNIKSLYEALIHYKTDETISLLTQTLNIKNIEVLKIHIEYLNSALSVKQDKNFNEIELKINEIVNP